MDRPSPVFHWLEARLGGTGRRQDIPGNGRVAMYAALASLLVSLFLFAYQPLINRDGILYITVAEKILEGDWQQAYWLFPWFFYPLLIAAVAFVSTIGVETSAHVVNALLASMMVWSFVMVLKELGASRAVQIVGAAILLLHPYFNDWRPAIVREHGFYAFLLMSALFYLRYQKDLSWKNAALWFSALLLATLFRIQGVAYFIFIPVMAAMVSPGPWSERMARASKPMILLLGTGILAVIAFLIVGGTERSPLVEPLMRLEIVVQALGSTLSEQATSFADNVLNAYTRDYAIAGLVATLLIAVIDKAIGSISILYLVLPILTGFRVFERGTRREWTTLATYALVGLAIAVGFVLSEQYTVSRYVAPFSLFVLLTAPYFLVALITKGNLTSHRGYRLFAYLVLLTFVGMSLDSLYESPSANRFLRDGGYWIRENLPADSRIYSNSNRLRYYAGLEIDWSGRNTGVIPGKQAWRETSELIPEGIEQNFDYAALALNRRRYRNEIDSLVQDPRINLIKEIEGPRGGGTLVFAVNR